ncbi:cell envelope biogenesis protein TolA [Chimaeribacter arupi]|uniref:cell envelope biogenesis protein TolA n=1 Tax=Chimaeribacter arupi TaxID=2060066 RepID=UPI0027120BDB|nr:cell envelope biogenesis protein TolA [Chimaeribacter arupi]WKZ93579.1 cell envelope biogenesis protein TolA [Chimaeribacter arupi]
MSEATDLVVIEKTNALTVFKSSDQIEEILQKVEREVMSFVPDVTTAKGRKEIASLAYRVSQTKSYLDGLGKDLVAELKEVPKLIDANRKTVRDRLDALRDKARQPYTEWEAEQERIKAEEEARIAAEKLAAQIESDHEVALLLNEKFDRDAAEAAAEAERQRVAHEEALKRQAAEQARQEAEAAAQRERDEAAKREADLKAAKEKAEADAKAAQERAEREAKEMQERAARLAQEAREKAERDKQEAIAAERRKAEMAEEARQAEVKRLADEKAAREADKEHRKSINNKALADLVSAGLTEDQAKIAITAIAKGEVTAIRISY